MAQISLLFLLLLVFSVAGAEYPNVRRRSRARAFIELQCQTTRYPELCVSCLSKYISNFTTTQSHQQLAQIALRLTNCIKETQNITQYGQSEFPWHASNVQTWMSAAQTDASTCIDGFSGQAIGGKTKALIKAKVLNLVQVTSIALALFNKFAARYRPINATKP
ncbi:Plant invertase/pectin methylesterase inhibitor superfamily protein [Abeliophyllum distichum]|uniref:Plant invertase/pectin methylesterase inhibitor superfamily protein n=1 Tax=Abeliophyllum distichum TaxID=126358 RepID=A0ABD1PA82_9LAMI